MKGTVTARFVDTPIKKAMCLISQFKGYDLYGTNNVYIVRRQGWKMPPGFQKEIALLKDGVLNGGAGVPACAHPSMETQAGTPPFQMGAGSVPPTRSAMLSGTAVNEKSAKSGSKTILFDNQDVRSALAGLAKKAGMNLDLPENIWGNLTAWFVNLPPEKIIKLILESKICSGDPVYDPDRGVEIVVE